MATQSQTVNSAAKSIFLFGASMMLGALIWILSPRFTGHREPWDSDSGYYWLALLVAGFLPSCFCSQRFWLWPLAILIGQAAFLTISIMQPDQSGALFPLGLLFLCFYSLVSFAGAAIGAGVHRLFRR